MMIKTRNRPSTRQFLEVVSRLVNAKIGYKTRGEPSIISLPAEETL